MKILMQRLLLLVAFLFLGGATLLTAQNPCPGDTEPPTVSCLNGMTAQLTPNGEVTIWAQDLDAGSTDNCADSTNLQFLVILADEIGTGQLAPSITFTEDGLYFVRLTVFDAAGNSSFCDVIILIGVDGGISNCNQDTVAPTMVCNPNVSVLANLTGDVTITPDMIDENSFDLCSELTFNLNLLSASTGEPTGATSLDLPAVLGDYNVELWGIDTSGNHEVCYTTVSLTGYKYILNGQVFADLDNDCTLSGDEANTGIGNAEIVVTMPNGNIHTTVSDESGFYTLDLPIDGLSDVDGALVDIFLANGLASGCASSVTIDDPSGDAMTLDFPVQLNDDCSYLTVDVSTPFLRRCFDNVYYIQYTSYSSFDINDAEVVVQLDDDMEFTTASVPFEDLGNGSYRFTVGTVAAGTSGSFTLTVLLSCEAELGATHCVDATITPFDCSGGSSYAELVVTGECEESTNEVVFKVKNEGNAGMSTARQIMVVEDVVMLMSGDPIQLAPNEEVEYRYPANGATYRLEIDQDENFPFGGSAAAFVEGCNGFTPGMALQFSLSDQKPNAATDCQENIGSWDPNDKQAFPRGYGAENFIKANTDIEYLIRFQNTGTDTAFNIRIEDQISEYLDPTSVIPGASSHPYRMTLNEAGLMNFYFDNIMLPDSNINEAASHGFVKFKISQMPDNAIGTLIENTAGIYFDFNEPVITNTVPLKIGEEFVAVSSQEVFVPNARLSVAPNPFQDQTTFRLDGLHMEQAQLRILSTQGRVVRELSFSGSQVQLDRKDLTTGLYFFQIVGEGTLVASGKLMVK